jgi:site-specific recombinase XerD
MKLVERERVEGTQVTIGRRVFYGAGEQRATPRYSAEYRDLDGRQVCQKLGTTNRVKARRLALEIQQRLETGVERPVEAQILVEPLVEQYLASIRAKGAAPKTVAKYETDLDKLKEFCGEAKLTLARQFGEDDLYRFRQWLAEKDYAPKTVQGALVLAKQLFKWAWRQRLVREYRLAAASFPKARARPQPCFTSAQVEALIEKAVGEEKAAFALMGYAGLRIGEAEQLRWEDLRERDGQLAMIHVRRGGSNGATKDKDERFVPVHPKIPPLLGTRQASGLVFRMIRERTLLQRLKELCGACKFEDPEQYKLHSFRHHFASLCANHRVAYRKALAWLGHSSSEMLDLYYHLHDEDSQQAMQALAQTGTCPVTLPPTPASSSSLVTAKKHRNNQARRKCLMMGGLRDYGGRHQNRNNGAVLGYGWNGAAGCLRA